MGYTGEVSSSSEPKKEVRYISVKNEEKLKEVKPKIENPTVVKRTISAKLKEKGKSLPKNQRGASSKALVSSLWHTRAHKAELFQASCTKKVDFMRGQESSKRRPKGAHAKGDSEGHLIGDVMEMLKNISLCFASFTLRFERYVGRTPPSKAFTQNTRKV